MTIARTTALFPRRVTSDRVAGEAELRAWRETPAGRAFYDAMAVHVTERLGVRAGRIISVGAGDGVLAARLAASLPDVEVVGLDVSAVTDLARHGPAQAIVVMQAFHHLQEPARALREMFSALAPGGSLLVIDLRRDAETSAYLRRLDGDLDAARFVKARLLRASVAAAHTGPELLAMAAPLRGAACLSRFRWTPGAQIAYGRVDADSLAPVMEELAGLMLELQLVRPCGRAAVRRSPERTAGVSSPRPAPARRGRVQPLAEPAAPRPGGRAGVGTILWSATGEQLWSDAGAREQGRRCPADWGELLADDARRVALETSQRVIERTFALDAHDRIVARSGWCEGAGAVAVVTTLEEVRTSLNLGALVARCRLTAREVEVAELAAAGLGSREIGVRLGIATPTVGTYLTHLYQKTGASGRLELARLVLLAQGAQSEQVLADCRAPARAVAKPRRAATS